MNSLQLQLIEQDIEPIYEVLKDDFNKLAGKTVLIVGSTGLLGSYIADSLRVFNQKSKDMPCKVICINRSLPAEASRTAHLLNDANFSFLAHDASVAPDLSKLAPKLDYIFWCAGSSNPKIFLTNELEAIDININGLRWALEYAKNNEISGFLYFSSGAVYGDYPTGSTTVDESYNGSVATTGPRACYTESKRLAETLCSIYAKKFNLPIKIARIFITYGPEAIKDGGKVLSDFLNYVLNGKIIEMKGDGSEIRSYCYVSDATEAFWRLMFHGERGVAYNVGSDTEEISIKQLAQTLHALLNIKEANTENTSSQSLMPHIGTAPKQFLPNINKLRALGFAPKISVKDGLLRTIKWHKLSGDYGSN